MMLQQAFLRSGTTVRTAWIGLKAKAGDQVTLKNSEDPHRRWNVVAVYARMPADQLHTDWHNNI